MNTYIFIHGGESFTGDTEYKDFISSTLVEWNKDPISLQKLDKKKWKIELVRKLIETGNLVYLPEFPNSHNAKYREWKSFFSQWITRITIQGSIIFIATSLGGNFLLKYFSDIVLLEETDIAHTGKRENSLHIDSQVREILHKNISQIHLIATCITSGDFKSPDNYNILRDLGESVQIWHSEDDRVVPVSHAESLQKYLPKARMHIFPKEQGYNHFFSLEQFPELENELLSESKSNFPQ